MLNSSARRRAIIHLNLREIGPWDDFAGGNNGERGIGQLAPATGKHMPTEQQHPIDLSGQGEVHVAGLLFRALTKIGDDQPVICRRQRFVDTAQNIGEKGVRNIGHDDQYHHRFARPQVSRGDIRRIADLTHGGEDTLPRRLGNNIGGGEGTAHGGDGDPGKTGDIGNLSGRRRRTTGRTHCVTLTALDGACKIFGIC